MLHTFRIRLKHRSYLRDPEETELGRRMVAESIRLIDALGFEQFTFKKLAIRIGSTEASVYRYFENKHKLLIYLVSWYWAWVDYQIQFKTNNISDPEARLRIIIAILSELNIDDPASPHVDESILQRIVVAESSKAYLIKNVDALNKEGMFLEYKTVCDGIAELILKIKPTYPYPHALVSTMIEAAHQQVFFAYHLPWLTEPSLQENPSAGLRQFLEHIAFSALKN